MCVSKCHGVNVCGVSNDNLEELLLSCHHVGTGNPTQAIRLGGRCLYLLKHLTDPNR